MGKSYSLFTANLLVNRQGTCEQLFATVKLTFRVLYKAKRNEKAHCASAFAAHKVAVWISVNVAFIENYIFTFLFVFRAEASGNAIKRSKDIFAARKTQNLTACAGERCADDKSMRKAL